VPQVIAEKELVVEELYYVSLETSELLQGYNIHMYDFVDSASIPCDRVHRRLSVVRDARRFKIPVVKTHITCFRCFHSQSTTLQPTIIASTSLHSLVFLSIPPYCSSYPSIMSSTATKTAKIRYFLINKDYGDGLQCALCDAFLDELNKRRGGVALKSVFDVERSDPHAVAIFDEKGSDWCAGGERAKIVKVAVPESCMEWFELSDCDGLESFSINFERAFFQDMETVLANDHATIEDFRAVKTKNDAMMTDYYENDTIGYYDRYF
jgi:hypothetical protein